MINRRGWLVVVLWGAAFVVLAASVSHVHVKNQVSQVEGR